VQMPMVLARPDSHCMHWVWSLFGCVPGGQASQTIPSALISFGPQSSQNVLWSLNVHLLPVGHGLSSHVATAAPNSETALDCTSVGSSMLEFVMRALSVELIRRVAPRGASFWRNVLARIVTWLEPDAATAPPRPVLTRNSVLDQKTSYVGQQSGPLQSMAMPHPGYRSMR
jgi:hypothetical protein